MTNCHQLSFSIHLLKANEKCTLTFVAKALRFWGIEATVRNAKRERKLWNLIWPDEVRLELKSRSGDSNGVKQPENGWDGEWRGNMKFKINLKNPWASMVDRWKWPDKYLNKYETDLEKIFWPWGVRRWLASQISSKRNKFSRNIYLFGKNGSAMIIIGGKMAGYTNIHQRNA